MFTCFINGELRGVEDKSYTYEGSLVPRFLVHIEDEEGKRISLTSYSTLSLGKTIKKGSNVMCKCEVYQKRDSYIPCVKLLSVDEI